MKPPEKPRPTDCCGTGCFPCVYDLYLDELERYRAWLNEQEAARADEEDVNTDLTQRAPSTSCSTP